MNVLLLGSGGREHAIGWKLVQSPLCDSLTSCPGNPGLAGLGDVVADVDQSDPDAVVALARERSINLVVIGPEAPLAAGVADALRGAGIDVFGPTASGARLEASKSFAKDVMRAASVPTAAATTFKNPDEAKRHLTSADGPYVVKADGLAAGKGVLVTDDLAAAKQWVDECLTGRFAAGASSVVIEEHMEGDEVSVFFICAGGTAIPLEPARDYKRLGDGESGPNTGGMGSFSPVTDLPPDLVAWTHDHVALPVLGELTSRGIDYTGFLYVGLMLTGDGPRVVEFNVRLGDPETQVLMPRLESDLLTTLASAASGQLDEVELRWNDTAVVNVVLASQGYPTNPSTGDRISMDDTRLPGALVFHAGTSAAGTELETAGGRVLNVVGTGATTAEARALAYAQAATITFTGKQYRTDIGA